MIKFKFWRVFAFIFYITVQVKPISTSTHWVVTENGRIQSQLDSAFHMRRPYDLLSLLEQEKRAEKIEHLYKEMLGRKAAIDVEWAGLESATDLEVRLYGNDKDCLQAGKPLTDMDLYVSVADDAFGREGILLSELLPSEVTEDSPDYPDCKETVDLDFSMDTFPHLQALSWNLSTSSEFLETRSLGEQSPHLIAAGLVKNKTSWFLYNLAAIYWRTQGDAQKALDCSKRAVHFSPRQYRDVALLNLGCILQHARCPAEAAILLHAAVDHAPKRAIAHYALANVYAILGDYNRSVACYDNALTLKPRWTSAERNRYAVLCHHKLEVSLYQLHRSLQGILTQLHDYHELQEHWLKYQEELMFQQAPLQVKLQDYQHESLSALLSHRDKCVPMVQDGNTVLNCDQLLAHHLQIDITLSLQLLLKNVESQAQKISEQMSHRMTGVSLGSQHSSRMELLKDSEENIEEESDTNMQYDPDGRLEIFIDGVEEMVDVEENDSRSLDEILEEISDKLKDNVMDIVDDIVEKHHLGWFNLLKLRELSFLTREEKQCQTSNHPLSGECIEHKLDLWSWNHDGTENQLFSMMGMSEEGKFFQNSCFQMRCHVLASLIITWFQLGEWNLIDTKNTVSNETPKCTEVSHPLTELTSESYGQIMPEPRLKPLLAALLDDENINLSDIALRISHALKVTTSRTIATAAALYWRYVGDVEQTVACLQLAVDAAPPNSKDSPLHNVAQILLTLGHNKEALLLATLALKVSPQSVFAHTELFHIYNTMGDKVKAVQYGRSAVLLQEHMQLLKKQ